MNEHEERLAIMRAEVDQAVATSEELARAIDAYFTALRKKGFSRSEALTLTLAWQASIFAQPSQEESE